MQIRKTKISYCNASIKRPLLLNAPSNRRPCRGRLLETYFFPCIICWTVFGSNYSAVVLVLSKNIRVALYLKFYFAE